MCIMAGPVESVSNTRIFVGADSRGLRQVVLYAMAVQLQARSGKGNAMILPVPGGATDVALFDLTAYPTIFDDIDAPFVVRSRGVSKDLDRSFGEPLEVHRVGSYDVSIVPTVDDVTPEDEAVLGHLFVVARQIARDLGIAENGYRLIVNCRGDGGQEVFHLHMHLLGGRKLGPMLPH